LKNKVQKRGEKKYKIAIFIFIEDLKRFRVGELKKVSLPNFSNKFFSLTMIQVSILI